MYKSQVRLLNSPFPNFMLIHILPLVVYWYTAVLVPLLLTVNSIDVSSLVQASLPSLGESWIPSLPSLPSLPPLSITYYSLPALDGSDTTYGYYALVDTGRG